MITLFFKRALDDIFKNRFLNLVTIITISLSVLIASAFILFFVNASEIITSWEKGLRIMAYLKPGIKNDGLDDLKLAIQALDDVDNLQFISKDESWRKIDALAARVEALPQIEEVEYGQQWVGRFAHIISLFRLAGYAMGTLFFMATIFIVANTIRLVIYSRREEVEIMRLVGATDNFIKFPFYFEGLIQGALGAIIGLGMLYLAFIFISSNVEKGFFPGLFRFNFLSPTLLLAIMLISMLVGWLGCLISLFR